MKQYQVPQFINIEDRVVGPLTIKQFLYLLAGAASGFIFYFTFQFLFFVIIMIPVTVISLSFAFLTVNGQSFPKIVFSALNFYMKPRLFVWQNIGAGIIKKAQVSGAGQANTDPSIPRPSQNRLSELAWSLDIKEKAKR